MTYLVAKEFNYELRFAGKSELVKSAVIVIPNGLSYHDPDSTSTVITSDLSVFPEDEDGNVINFKSVEDAQAWIDVNKDNIQFEIKNGNELHAIRQDVLINKMYRSVNLTDNKNKEWSVQGYTDGKNFFFAKEALQVLNDHWDSDMDDNTGFTFRKNGDVILHDGLQDLDLPVKMVNGLYKFPERWNWIEVAKMNDGRDLNDQMFSDNTIKYTVMVGDYIAVIGEDAVYDDSMSVVTIYRNEDFPNGDYIAMIPFDKKGIETAIKNYITEEYLQIESADEKQSSQKNDFISYCSSRTSELPASKDSFGNIYPTLLKCSINGVPDCSIISVPENENALCWIDNNGQRHIDYNNAPDVYAAYMSFDQIDSRFLEQLKIHWDGLFMDEQIDLYKSRDLVSDSLSKEDEPVYYVQL